MGKKIFKTIIISVCCIFLLFVLFLILFPIFANSELFLGKQYGPYHHEALITVPTKSVTAGGRMYCWYDEEVYEMKDGSFTFVSTRHVQDEDYIGGVNDIKTDGTDLYIASADDINSISVFSSDFSYKETLVSGGARSLLLDGDKIYYFTLTEIGSDVSRLRCYDRSTGQDVFVTDGFTNDVYEVNGKVMYANAKGNLYWADETEGVNLADDYILNSMTGYLSRSDRQSLGFYYAGKTGTVTVGGGNIALTYDGKTAIYPLNGENMLYNRILVSEGKLLFATVEYAANTGCNNDFCICHVGVSKLFSYDFATGEFSLKQEFREREYFISFDDAFISYYSDGKVIRNGAAVAEVEKAAPYGAYMQYGTASKGGETRISRSVFYDDGKTVYHCYDDNFRYIKDVYF